MAITPRASQDRVQQAPLPGLRTGVSAPLEAFGGGREAQGLHQEIQGTLGDAEKIAQEETYKADQIAVMKQAAALTAEKTRLLHDPKTGALNRRGENAFGAPKEVSESWQKTVSELEKSLVGDRQKMAFRRMALDKQGDIDRSLQQHVSVEKRRYDDDTTNDYVQATEDRIVEAYADPNEVTKGLTEIDASLRDYGARNGESSDSINLRINKRQSAAVRAVIFRALEKNEDQRAKEYLEAGARDFLKGDDLAKVEQAVEKWSTLGKATRTTDELAKLPSLSEARAKMKEMGLSDEVREKTDSMLVREFALKERADEQFHDKQMSASINNIVQRFKSGESAELLVGPQWNDLSGADQLKLEGLVDDLNRPEGIKTKMVIFAKLHGMTQAQLAGYTEEKLISEFLVGLDQAGYNHARKLWVDAKQSGTAFKSLKKDSEIVFDAMRGAKYGGLAETDTLETISRTSRGKLVDPKGEEKAGAYKKVWDAVELEREKYFGVHKANPDDKEMKRFAAGAAMKFARDIPVKQRMLGFDAMWRDKVVKLGDLTPDELKTAEIDVPPPLMKKFHALAISEPGLLSKGMGVEAFAATHRERVNLAYLASINGEENWDNILKILKGE